MRRLVGSVAGSRGTDFGIALEAEDDPRLRVGLVCGRRRPSIARRVSVGVNGRGGSGVTDPGYRKEGTEESAAARGERSKRRAPNGGAGAGLAAVGAVAGLPGAVLVLRLAGGRRGLALWLAGGRGGWRLRLC